MIKIYLSNGKELKAKLKISVDKFIDTMGEFTFPIESVGGKVFYISKNHIVAIEEMEDL